MAERVWIARWSLFHCYYERRGRFLCEASASPCRNPFCLEAWVQWPSCRWCETSVVVVSLKQHCRSPLAGGVSSIRSARRGSARLLALGLPDEPSCEIPWRCASCFHYTICEVYDSARCRFSRGVTCYLGTSSRLHRLAKAPV